MSGTRLEKISNAGCVLAAAVAPVLASYAITAANTLPPTVLLWPLALSVVGAGIFFGICVLALRNIDKAAFFCSCALLAFFLPLYISIVIAIFSLFGVKPDFLLAIPVLVLIVVLIIAAAITVIWRNTYQKPFATLRGVLYFFVPLQIIAIGIQAFAFISNVDRAKLPYANPKALPVQGMAPPVVPNFYYIILDGYGNPETYRNYYDYDNKEFINQLSALDFKVIEKSSSNYCLTELSLCSSLNLDYLTPVAKTLGDKSTDLTVPCWLLENNQVLHYVRSQGYRYINLGSTFGPTAWNIMADENIPGGMLDMFALNVCQFSLGGILASYFKLPYMVDYYRSTQRAMFNNVAKVAAAGGKKFVFAHIELPHPPLVFNADGTASGTTALAFDWPQEGRQQYVEQTKYTEKMALGMLKEVTTKDPSAVIVLQSDHGPGFDQGKNETPETWRRNRMLIFNAWHVPKTVPVPEAISAVNNFRYLFNQTLGAGFEILPNRALFSTYALPYSYTEIEMLFVEKTK